MPQALLDIPNLDSNREIGRIATNARPLFQGDGYIEGIRRDLYFKVKRAEEMRTLYETPSAHTGRRYHRAGVSDEIRQQALAAVEALR